MMKKKIVILGSTGSIGRNTIDIIRKDKKKFNIKILSTNTNIDLIIRQAKEFNVKHLIISDYSKYLLAKKKYENLNINFYNSYSILEKILKKKEVFYTMISIVGLDGLEPCLKMIRLSENIAIVNKESIICGWRIIQKNLRLFNTRFIPIDSEHFSIYSLIENKSKDLIEKIYLTASGGPFLKYKKSKLKSVSLNNTLNHPNWKMGKKISVDSATMMNKVFEVIEAKNIFNLNYNQIEILTHPKSYIHGVVKFNNGITKFLAHDPDMKIPIHNSLYKFENKKIFSKQIDLKVLNNLEFKKINKKQFLLIKILDSLPHDNTLYETALVTINDYFVSKYLEKKINFLELIKLINTYAFHKEFIKFKKFNVKNVKEIYKIRNYVRLKLDKLSV